MCEYSVSVVVPRTILPVNITLSVVVDCVIFFLLLAVVVVVVVVGICWALFLYQNLRPLCTLLVVFIAISRVLFYPFASLCLLLFVCIHTLTQYTLFVQFLLLFLVLYSSIRWCLSVCVCVFVRICVMYNALQFCLVSILIRSYRMMACLLE